MDYELKLNIENHIVKACQNGNINILKIFLNKKLKIDFFNTSEGECAFKEACYFGHLNILKWVLFNNPKIDIDLLEGGEFVVSCAGGQLKIAQWLLQMQPNINIFVDNGSAFRWACINGHLHVAQWLQSLMPFKYIITKNGSPHIIIKNASVTLAIIYLLKTKGYTLRLTANLVYAIATHA